MNEYIIMLMNIFGSFVEITWLFLVFLIAINFLWWVMIKIFNYVTK